ncbi:hypothetical protein SeMB42_g06657 [Synchytrium endobioticum]|uniref:BRCT domain-containing protein n=1 Tax=Synchytrium endobioticum TaxID=286115 RepID=A0A507CBY5_9FUNG|nr:hypothetical protein SeMB42_g06657 [Synchytrium endobioticum]TPX49621.1 hypothetical protein SeLEV6574_g01352 [Synchytrium endobioticum]
MSNDESAPARIDAPAWPPSTAALESPSRTIFGKFRIRADNELETIKIQRFAPRASTRRSLPNEGVPSLQQRVTLKPRGPLLPANVTLSTSAGVGAAARAGSKAHQCPGASNDTKRPAKFEVLEADTPPAKTIKTQGGCFSTSNCSSTADTSSAAPSSKHASKKNARAPLARQMAGVSFVISGLVNPERAEVRDMALEMGAKFEPNWRSFCTHLICAYTDTPKYKQAKESGFGIIVSPNWIVDSHKAGKRLPESAYDLDNPSPI